MADDSPWLTSKAQPFLSRNQQKLLLAALSSQAQSQHGQSSVSNRKLAIEQSEQPTVMAHNNGALFFSPQDVNLDQFDVDFTPDGDFLDGDQSFDFDDTELGGDLIGGLPDLGTHAENAEQHEKRKNPTEDDENEEGDAKRQELHEGEKTAKKPGRKPLTNEPTTKRKAQNRAAQRAFRERKEKHLKDLETKVEELEKAKEADRHENGLLKAQLERMSVELREYRKRLSLSGGLNRSPTISAVATQHRSSSGSAGNNFQFDFPKFGGLPGSQMFGSPTAASTTSPAGQTNDGGSPSTRRSPPGETTAQLNQETTRTNSTVSSLSPPGLQNASPDANTPATMSILDPAFTFYSTSDNMHGFASTLPQMGSDLGDLFSPSILKSANADGYFNTVPSHPGAIGSQLGNLDAGGESTAGLERVFQFNGGSSLSDSTSPSASSASQWNANGAGTSSCETSPEPSHDSPQNKDKIAESNYKSSRQSSAQPVYTNLDPQNKEQSASIGSAFNFSPNDYSVPSTNSFDPVLFGDYRDSQDAIVGGGDFTGGFFDDALNSAPFDFESPSNLFGILQSPKQTHVALKASSTAANAPTPSRNLLAEVEKNRDGGDDDYGLSSHQPEKVEGERKLISCNHLWNQLQSNRDFQEGKFDLDGLCAELRVKAKCSESGVMVDQAHVDRALKKLGSKDESGNVNTGSPSLMFAADSWDRALQKLGTNGR